MNSQDILRTAANIYNERGKQYGDVAFMFDTAAAMATLMTGREFSSYDITTVLEAVKLARLSGQDLELFRESFTLGMDWDRFSIEL